MQGTATLPRIRPKPQAYLRVGYACNSRCTFCCAQGGWLTPMRKLEEIKRELDRMTSEMDLESISISGGEPTIHPNILDIVRYARDKGFRNIHMNTHARGFKTPEIVRQYMDAGLNSVMVSIHGHTREIQDGIHRVKGAFDQMIKGVENVAANGLLYRFFTVICRANMDHLPDIVQFAHDRFTAFSSMIFCYPVIKELEGFDKESILIKYSEVKPRIRATIEKGSELGVRVLAQLIPPCLLDEHYYLATEFRRPDFYASEPAVTKFASFIEEDRLLLPACQSCEARTFCPRIQYNYVEHYGDMEPEIFTPLQGLEYDRVPTDAFTRRNIPV